MTTPAERTRSLRVASELLHDLKQRQDVPADIHARALVVLQHFPEEWQLLMMAEDWQRIGNSTFGLEPERGRPDPLDQRLTRTLCDSGADASFSSGV